MRELSMNELSVASGGVVPLIVYGIAGAVVGAATQILLSPSPSTPQPQPQAPPRGCPAPGSGSAPNGAGAPG